MTGPSSSHGSVCISCLTCIKPQRQLSSQKCICEDSRNLLEVPTLHRVTAAQEHSLLCLICHCAPVLPQDLKHTSHTTHGCQGKDRAMVGTQQRPAAKPPRGLHLCLTLHCLFSRVHRVIPTRLLFLPQTPRQILFASPSKLT